MLRERFSILSLPESFSSLTDKKTGETNVKI